MPDQGELTGEEGKGYYPYQASIDAYGNGGFRFADISHKGSLLCLPSGMHAWPQTELDPFDVACFSRVMDNADQLDVLLIGTGTKAVAIDPELRQIFRENRIVVEEIDTGGAIRTYNILLGERRSVGAALVAIDR